MGSRNRRRGFIRLWIVLSLAWIAGVSVIRDAYDLTSSYLSLESQIAEVQKRLVPLDNPFRDDPDRLYIAKLRSEQPIAELKSIAAQALLPPLAAALFAFGMAWVARGFRNG